MTARSIATVSLSGSLDEKLRAIAAAGFDAVEIFENDLLSFNGSPRDAWEIVRRADHKSIGVILDSFHALAPAFPVNAIESIPADKIFLVQLADAPKLGLDVLSWSRHFRCFPGQGDLPVSDFMEAVLRTGYAGPLSLEIFNDQFRSGSAVRTAIDGLRSLILLEDQLAEKSPNASAARLQPKARSRGVGFIEFAVGEAKAKDLSALFGQLGFRKTGSHRSKDVERWAAS